jgi:hypothetical protein
MAMRKSRLVSVTGTGAMTLAAGALIVLTHHQSAPAGPGVKPADQVQVSIDSSIGETFTPATSSGARSPLGAGTLSAQEAFSKAMGSDRLPADATVETGYLTMPLGAGTPDKYTANHQLVYAISWPQCGPRTQPMGAPSPAPPNSDGTTCRAWAFVDASSGELVDMTWTK